jgi:hypothetical protein
MLTVTLDWLAFTIKEMTENAEAWFGIHTPTESSTPDAPTNGYRSACRGPNGVVRMWNNDRPEMGHHVILSGSTLRSVVLALNTTQASLLQSAISTGGSVTRLDLAVDSEGVSIDERYIYLQSLAGKAMGTCRTFTLLEGSDGGKTVYMGSRQSERFIRIYDKGAQQGISGIHWHRMELETKGMVARSVAVLLVENSDWHAVFTGVCRKMASFSGIRDYQVFFDGVDVPIGTPKIEKRSDTEAWIEKQVTPAVAKHFIENENSRAVRLLIDMLDYIKRNGQAPDAPSD